VLNGALIAGLLVLAGCGNNYRPVISAISPVGPAAQTQKYAVAISNPNAPGQSTLPGIVTVVDVSGDTTLVTPNIGVNPQYLILGGAGGTGYTINGDGTISSFAISTTLMSNQVLTTTLPQATYNLTTCPLPASVNGALCLPTSIFPQGTYTYVTQPGPTPLVGQLAGSPPALQQEISMIGANPVFIAGVPSSPRVYAISKGPLATTGTTVYPTAPGTVAAINTTTNSVDSIIPVGTNPVYGVMTATMQRTFIMNQGVNNVPGMPNVPGSVTVINSQQNVLDTGTPPLPPAVAGNGTISDPYAVAANQGPVWADLAPMLNELVVANVGTSTSQGSVSIFNIPLCSTSALANNTNCNPNNPIDAYNFGTLAAHVPVGINPMMVAVLQDSVNPMAYVINQGDSTVSVINLTTDTVVATIPVPATPNPTFIAVTTAATAGTAGTGAPGKVYVTSSTSKTMTVIRTDTNTVDTTMSLQGYGVQVRVTAP
jgi:YVTN family beta-propeller protein